MRPTPLFLSLLAFALSCSLFARANSCDSFASYTCAVVTPSALDVNGIGPSGKPVGVLLGQTFTVSFDGHRSLAGADLIILAAAPDGLKGTLNGKSFTGLSTFPETGAPGAIRATWASLGIDFKSPQFGYVNLGTVTNLSDPITAMGVSPGTVFYAEIINPKTDKIVFITPNHDAGILGPGAVTPEPASLTLTGIGLVGLACLMRRKSSKSQRETRDASK
jgi:hypothetical protein